MTAAKTMKKGLVTLALGAMLATGAVVATPAQAEASVTHCGDGRCTVYLSKSETRAVAGSRIPPAAGLTGPLLPAYYALAYGHKWIAQQYANRGWCSGFRLSIYPWESQGYFGYACNWN